MDALVLRISNYFEKFNHSLSTNEPIIPKKNPLSYYVFDFERSSDQTSTTLYDLRRFMIERWQLSFIYAFAYLLLIYLGQTYMKNKPKFDLRLCLAAWSGLLAIFSIFGAVRVLPELIYVIYRHGIKYSICDNSNAFGVVGFWY